MSWTQRSDSMIGLDGQSPRGEVVSFDRLKHSVGRCGRLSDRELGFDDRTQQSGSTIGLDASGLNAIRLDDRTLTVRLVDQTPRGSVAFHRRKHAVGRGGILISQELGFDDRLQRSDSTIGLRAEATRSIDENIPSDDECWARGSTARREH